MTYICSMAERFFFSSRRRHTRWPRDWSSDVCSSDLRWFDDFELTTPYYRIFIYFVAEDLGQGEAIVNALDIKQQLRIYSSILTVGSTFVVGTAKDIVVEKTNVTSSGLSSITSQKYTTKSPLSRVYINNTSDIDMDFSIQVIGFDA